jgi:ubiquinone/menaquinone biosynthesis C-methylase UbiE
MSETITQKEFWDKEANKFDAIYSHKKSKFNNFLDRTFRWDMYERYRYTLEHSEPISGSTFLDVGCGSGYYALEFARRGAKKVTGIDVAPNMVELCRERAKKEGFEKVTSFMLSDLLEYESRDKFDVTIGIGLFDYIKDPLPVLTKMNQVTKRSVIATFPRAWTWRVPPRKIRLTLRGCPVFFYTRGKIEDILVKSEFKEFEMDKIGQLYCVTAFPK